MLLFFNKKYFNNFIFYY